MNEFLSLLDQAGKINGGLAAIAALAGLVGTIAGVIGTFAGVLITRFVLTPRDKQDREAEWRTHAIELTKLDLQRKLGTRPPNSTDPIRPSILDFLANYRDLQELGERTPKELYLKIEADRISPVKPAPPKAP